MEKRPMIQAACKNVPQPIRKDGAGATVREFPITTLAGVNMRLTPGGVRELHWHQQAEWAYMLLGRARITSVDQKMCCRPILAYRRMLLHTFLQSKSISTKTMFLVRWKVRKSSLRMVPFPKALHINC